MRLRANDEKLRGGTLPGQGQFVDLLRRVRHVLAAAADQRGSHRGAGVNASLLGTTNRTDGATEVTYGGHPLYYVATDHNPGDATGQGVDNFGAPWDVVGPDGKRIG